jgi:Ca2+-binding EF-hand superfamily protein
MKGIGIFSLAVIIMVGALSIGKATDPAEERARSAYKLILSQTDANKDGKLSLAECRAIYKDPALADKNCNFWDANKDGLISEDEYVKQAQSLGKKK